MSRGNASRGLGWAGMQTSKVCTTTCTRSAEDDDRNIPTSPSRLYSMSAIAKQANATIATERRTRFDTDSGEIGVNNRRSGCILHLLEDFEPDSLQPSNRVVKGFAGSRTTNVETGTLLWRAGRTTKEPSPNFAFRTHIMCRRQGPTPKPAELGPDTGQEPIGPERMQRNDRWKQLHPDMELRNQQANNSIGTQY
jgi:hypothetical protein